MVEDPVATVGGHQDRHLLACEAALLGFAAASTRLAVELPLPLPAHQFPPESPIGLARNR